MSEAERGKEIKRTETEADKQQEVEMRNKEENRKYLATEGGKKERMSGRNSEKGRGRNG